MNEFRDITAKFNVYDFLNPIISGTYFLLGLLALYFPIEDVGCKSTPLEGINNFILTILFYMILSYIIGLILQFISYFYFNKRKNQMIEIALKDTDILKYPLNSPFRLKILEREAIDHFKLKNLGDFDKANREHNSYFFAFCEYHNQVYGLSRKTETLREVWGLSKEMATASAILALWGSILCLQINNNHKQILLTIFFAGVTCVFWYRTKVVLRNWIVMVYSIYHVSNLDKSSSNNLDLSKPNSTN